MRLIDAEQLEQIFNAQVDEGATDLFDAFDYAIEHVDTIDPSSLVKRGRWEEMKGAYDKREKWFSCSECNYQTTEMFKKDYKFCPSCGARMQED